MSRKITVKERLRAFFAFSRREMRGTLWLLPLLAVAAAVITFANRPRFEMSFLEQVEEDGARGGMQSEARGGDRNVSAWQPSARRGFGLRGSASRNKAAYGGRHHATLTDFDPNALDAAGFEALGFTRRQAEAIVRYRTARGGFRTADDLGRSYVVSDKMFAMLRPYIKVSAPRPATEPAVDAPADAEKPTVAKPVPVELNTADSALLRTVSGIGEVLVVRIMDYRARLGGFARVDQLLEIPGMFPENYDRIVARISLDTCKIQKIDVNFATPKELTDALGTHPYITPAGLRKLLKIRQLKGGYATIEELVNENILTPRQAERLAPYLIFNRFSN